LRIIKKKIFYIFCSLSYNFTTFP